MLTFWIIFGITYLLSILLIYNGSSFESNYDYVFIFCPILNQLLSILIIGMFIYLHFDEMIDVKRALEKRRKELSIIRGRLVSDIDPYGEEDWTT